jgi:hypothetical protein
MPDLNRFGHPLGGRGRCWITDEQPLQDPHANVFAARGGRFLAWRAGHGVYNADGLIAGGAGMALVGDVNSARGAMGQDGTLALWLGYPDGGVDVRLLALDGSTVDIPQAWPQGNGSFAILDRGRAVWISGQNGEVRTHGLPVPVTLPGDKHNLVVFREPGGRLWIGYHANRVGRIVCHPFDALEGYTLDPGFYLAARETPGGVVLCTSWGAGDEPNAPVPIAFSTPRVDLRTLLPADPPPPPPDPDKEPPVSPSPDPRLVRIVNDHWLASGIVDETRRRFHEHREPYWKDRHARVLYEAYSLAYHEHGVQTFGVYPKPLGTTRFVPFPDRPREGYSEDVCQILDDAGVMFYKDIGVGFGGPNPSIEWGEFTRSRDEDQHPSAYLPPPRLAIAQPNPDPSPDPIEPKDPRVAPMIATLRGVVGQLLALPVVEQQPCELPHNPVCDRPHGVSYPVGSEPELQQIAVDLEDAHGRPLSRDLLVYLLYRFTAEGVSHTDNLEEARRRGRGE